MDIPNEYKKNLYLAILVLLVVLSLLFAMQFLSALRSYGSAGSSDTNTITISGYGEVQAVPDIANVYFTISKDAKTVKEAQDMVAKIENNVLSFLRDNNIAEKDIKTENFSFNPKYEYQYDSKIVPCTEYGCPPRPGKSVIVGYTSSESITVKVRNTDDAGKIMQGLGSLGVSQLNGPSFSIDDEDELKAEARREAISDARTKAKALAKDLGVRLGRVASFSEGGNYPSPMLYKSAMDSVESASSSVQLPKGENTISSNVTITYEIR